MKYRFQKYKTGGSVVLRPFATAACFDWPAL
jgi:hypothetical protein